MSQLNIRKMELEDLDRVVEIETSVFPSPWARSIFRRELENELAEYYVAVLDDEIIGYGGIWKIIGEAHITNITIVAEKRGNGFGKTMLEFLIKRVIKLKYYGITLEVRANNDVALSMYKKHGFEEVGIRKNYYPAEKQDAIIMWRTLFPEDCV